MNVAMAFHDDRKTELQLVAVLGSFIVNYGGMGAPDRMVRPEEIMPSAFDGMPRGGVPTREELAKYYRRHEERLERERRRKERNNGGD